MRQGLAGIILLLCLTPTFADDTSTKRVAQNEVTSPKGIDISEVAIGDYWTYELRDEIAGKVAETQKVIVTDISRDQVATRVDVINTERSDVILFDKSWNVLRDGPARYSPNSGTGIRSPLILNAEWKATIDEVNDKDRTVRIINLNSRVTGQEGVTTKAGTFQTYTIESTQAVRYVREPVANTQFSIRTWFSPEVNHWIRRNTVERVDGLVVRNETMELLKYGRKDTP